MKSNLLYRQIADFDIDGEIVPFPFAKKLAREHGWTVSFAQRAINEYKRFLYLAVSEGAASPSPVVDQVWHLHLTYTESYWNRLCRDVLGTPLHHYPSRGENESENYRQLYLATLDAYRREFQEEPPAEIWLTQPARNARTQLTKKKLASLFLLPAVALLIAGCSRLTSEPTREASWFAFGGLVLLAGLSFASLWHKSGQRGESGSGAGGMSTGIGCGSGDADGSCGDGACGSGCGGGGCGGGSG